MFAKMPLQDMDHAKPLPTGRTGRAPKPWNKRGKDGDVYDDVVIGSGVGGMACAALLSEIGRRVLVLEQHAIPGGFTHRFRRRGYDWDVGVHAVGETGRDAPFGRFLEALTDGQLRWTSLGKVYDEFQFPDDVAIEFPDSETTFRETLLAAFPNEQQAIDRWINDAGTIRRRMDRLFRFRSLPSAVGRPAERLFAASARRQIARTTESVLQSITQSDRLRTILSAQWGYSGSIPSEQSYAYQAMVTDHFLQGAAYPVGGVGQIAETLLARVAGAGGWTRVATRVEAIAVENGRATGVHLSGGEVVRAERVFSAVGIPQTIGRLLPRECATAISDRFDQLHPSAAHVCLYIGFKGDIRKVGAGAANKWFFDSWSRERRYWDVDPEKDMPQAPILYCSFPSLKDPDYDPGPEQKHTGTVVTFVPWDAFQTWQGTRWMRRGRSYEDFKERLRTSLLQQFLAHMPELGPMIDYSEISTPLSTTNFTEAPNGSIYGLASTPERFANMNLRPHSGIAGLYFAGADIATSGVAGSFLGGILAATAAEPRLAGGWVMKRMRQ